LVDKVDNILTAGGRNLPLKILALFLAVSAWWFVARENNVFVSFSVPIEIRNTPKGLTLTNKIDRHVEVRLQGPSYILSGFKPSDMSMTLDLSNGKPGHQTVNFDLQAMKMPVGIQIQRVFPQAVDVVLDWTERRNIPVSVKIKELKLIQHRIRSIEVEPQEVEVEALPEEFSRMPVAYTQEIEVEPGVGIFTTVARVELAEAHAKITSDPNVRIKIHFH